MPGVFFASRTSEKSAWNLEVAFSPQLGTTIFKFNSFLVKLLD